ncbi:MAG TPA: hypothetical protein VEH10_05955 [Thermoplasmata archaeon]|nr:hypothetical protein [Thermoplasmata archaeon]
MSAFRGSDEDLDHEIAAVQTLVRVRLRRATTDLRELETALTDLRRERRRRQLAAVENLETRATVDASA